MPFPKALARVNQHVTNPLLSRLAGRVRPFALLIHQGRSSGQEHRTPVWAFPEDTGFIIALTYGKDVNWVKNVVPAGGCELEWQGQRLDLVEPVLIGADGLARVPPWVRPPLRLLRVTHYLVLTTEGPARCHEKLSTPMPDD